MEINNLFKEKVHIDIYDLKTDLAYRIVELLNSFSFLNKALIEENEEQISEYGKIFYAQFRTLLYAISPFFDKKEIEPFFKLVDRENEGKPNPDIKGLIKKLPEFFRLLKSKGIYDLTSKTIDPSKAFLD